MDYITFTEAEFNQRTRTKGKFIEGERWAFISDCDWEGLELNWTYHVSDFGRILFNDWLLFRKRNYIDHTKGYTQVSIGNKVLYMHRLVAFYFVENPNPSENTQVNHKDLNKKNNHFTNLEWVTPKMNIAHYRKAAMSIKKINC